MGPLTTEVAGEVANGVISHGFTTVEYLQRVTIPAVERGLVKSGRDRADFDISVPAMVVAGATEEAFEESRRAIRAQLGFYASTPAYRPVLELHGWGDLQGEANQLTREDRWDDLGALITDEILNTFALVSEDIDQVPSLLKQRFGGLIDTWMCTVDTGEPARQKKFIKAIQSH